MNDQQMIQGLQGQILYLRYVLRVISQNLALPTIDDKNRIILADQAKWWADHGLEKTQEYEQREAEK